VSAWQAVRAPEGAVAWIPRVGWTDDAVAIRERQDVGEAVYVVCHGDVGVDDDVLAAVMRIDADREDLRTRVVEVYADGSQSVELATSGQRAKRGSRPVRAWPSRCASATNTARRP
jgi:hypothetical protein